MIFKSTQKGTYDQIQKQNYHDMSIKGNLLQEKNEQTS